MLKCLIAIAIRAKKGFSFLLPCGVARNAKPISNTFFEKVLKRYRFLVLKFAFAKKLLISI